MTNLNDVLFSLGVFRVLFAGVIQYNSICFRVLGGLVYPNLLASVAIVTAIEFILNAILEIPCGFIADKFGKTKIAILGLYFVSIGTFFLMLSFIFHYDTNLSYFFLVCNATLIGVGKPLYSGSIEAFYQQCLMSFNRDGGNSKVISNSFSSSVVVGRYVPLLFVISAFIILWIFDKLSILPFSLLVSSLLFIFLSVKLGNDYKSALRAGIYKPEERQNVYIPQLRFFASRDFLVPVIFSTLILAIAMLNLGFFIISLGRELNLSIAQEYFVFGFYMIGVMFIGWIASSYILPFLSLKFGRYKQIVLYFSFFIFVNFFLLNIGLDFKFEILLLIMMVYGAAFQIVNLGVVSICKNMVLDLGQSENLATILSIANIIPFILVSIISTIIAFFCDGALSLKGSFNFLISTSFLGVLVILFIFNKEDKFGDN